MKLATIRTANGTRSVRVDDARAIETGHSDIGDLLSNADWKTLAVNASGPSHDVTKLDYETLVTNPDKVICVGLNYRDHIEETGRPKPAVPTLFTKFARTLIGANDPIEMPAADESTMIDWEAELGLVIGTEIRRATREQAEASIAGYTVINDISVRDYQNHTTQFLPGKSWEHTTPVGPTMLVAEVGVPAHFPISCTVDGEVMQSSNTSQLLFDPATVIEFISTFITLVPGDIIATGTPSGVGHARSPQVFLTPGQTVVTSIEGVGECRNICRR